LVPLLPRAIGHLAADRGPLHAGALRQDEG
jgi:hypothetical protein